MERLLRGATYAIGGLFAAMIGAGALSEVVGEWVYPNVALLLFGTCVVAGFRYGFTRPVKGQAAESPRWTRKVRVALAGAAVVIEAVFTVALQGEGGWAFFPAVGLVLAVLLLFGVASINSRRNAITLLAPVWIVEVVALSAFVFPGVFVAAPTVAATLGALLPDGNASVRRERRPATVDQWVLRAAVAMIALGTTSLLLWWTAA